ncbi:MAG TPA: T9SS type A sorting domain-containing protein, partial [Flavobacteriales bacterium]|nr:T9SS type A sorting domain-containing protein [Flavobacteriales bacterium]
LTQPLVQGQTYYASFYANAGWGGYEVHPQHWVATSHIGMLFTMQSHQWEYNDPFPAPGNFAHVVHPWVIADTVGWTLVSGSFVADSAYRYLMIGNHFDNAATDTIHLGHSIQYERAMMLIDKVCVSASPDGCALALGVVEPTLDHAVLFPNPATSELVIRGLPHGVKASVWDARGRSLWVGSTTVGTWRMDVGAWARGSYVLRLEQGSRNQSFKFVLIE